MLRLLLILTLASRVVASGFVDGFEDDFNSDGLPDGWYRKSDNRTHPLYNWIDLVTDAPHVREAKRAVRLSTRGGNVALVSAVPSPLLTRIDPRKGYSLAVWTMTEGLASSRAFATVQWLDALGRPLAPEQKTDAVGGTHAWTLLEAPFEPVPETARFVRFGLHLEGNDFSGSAWFDDLVWREEIRIRVEDLSRRGFVVREGQSTRIEATCEDLEVGEYELAFWAHEFDGRDVPIALEERAEERVLRICAEGSARQAVHVGRSRKLQARYRIEGIPTGFVDLVLSLRLEGEEVARRRVGFISPPERFFARGRESHWGVEVRPDTDPEVVDRLGALHLGYARVLFWEGSPEREEDLARSGAIDELLFRLTRSGMAVSGSIAIPPPEFLPEGTSQAKMAQFLSGPQATWAAALRGTFSKHRETIQEWRLGGTDDVGYKGRSGLDDLAASVVGELSKDLPNVDVTVPLPIRDAKNGVAQLVTARTLHGVDFYLPADLDPEEAKTLLAEVAIVTPKASVTIGMGELTTGQASESFPAQASALWKLAGTAMHEKVLRLSVTPLVSYRAGLFDIEGTPTPLASSLWVLHNALGEMEPYPVTWLPLNDKRIEQLVFRRQSQTAILAWFKGSDARVDLPLYLGHDVKALRVDGRIVPLEMGADGVLHLKLGREPVILYDIDTYLFDTLQTMKFVPAEVFSKSGPQEVELQFQNAFDERLSIREFKIEFPKYWESTIVELSEVAPRGTAHVRVPVSLPESQTLRAEGVTIRLSFTAGRSYDGLIVNRPLDVKSESGTMLAIEPRWKGEVLEVEVRVVNGNRPAGYVISMGLGAGIPIQTDVTGTIEAEKAWSKVYRFTGASRLDGRVIRVKLNEPQATTFLSLAMDVPPRP